MVAAISGSIFDQMGGNENEKVSDVESDEEIEILYIK